jgi:hypothetical protein
MARPGKHLSFCLAVLLVVNSTILLSAKPADAQSIPKPFSPEFKLSYTNYVYDQPSATSQWSGEPIPNSSYHYDYRDVYIKVRNQPNDAYINENSDNNGIREKLYYNVRVKNHFSNDWVELYGQSPVYASNGSVITGTWYWGASDSEVTSIGSIALNGRTNIIHASRDVAVGDQVEFPSESPYRLSKLRETFFLRRRKRMEQHTNTYDRYECSNNKQHPARCF